MRVSHPEHMFAHGSPYLELPIGAPADRENPWPHRGNTTK